MHWHQFNSIAAHVIIQITVYLMATIFLATCAPLESGESVKLTRSSRDVALGCIFPGIGICGPSQNTGYGGYNGGYPSPQPVIAIQSNPDGYGPWQTGATLVGIIDTITYPLASGYSSIIG
ncbi:uncharacterized protein [Bemisia tabaci]|uniref:uncharacterized protein n=1 Tax=Bemisia tabaci TaxID=7038 RepID=UPI003B282909